MKRASDLSNECDGSRYDATRISDQGTGGRERELVVGIAGWDGRIQTMIWVPRKQKAKKPPTQGRGKTNAINVYTYIKEREQKKKRHRAGTKQTLLIYLVHMNQGKRNEKICSLLGSVRRSMATVEPHGAVIRVRVDASQHEPLHLRPQEVDLSLIHI